MSNADTFADTIIEALKKSDADTVISIQNEALQTAVDQPDLLAKMHGWIAQAYLLKGNGEKAMKHSSKGIRHARSVFDDQGVKILKDIRSRAISIQQAQQQFNANSDSLLAQADEAFKSNNIERARALTEQAIQIADSEIDVREQILARLMMVRIVENKSDVLAEALEIADKSNDKNLVTAVKKAMDAIGIEIPTHVF